MELSEEQIHILRIFYQKNEIDIAEFRDLGINEQSNAFTNLKKDKYLIDGKSAPYQIPDVIGFYPISIQISEKGKAAYENYRNSIRTEQRAIDTLETAKQANEIAKDANKKSHNANILSIIAIAVPSALSIAALIVSILAYLKG